MGLFKKILSSLSGNSYEEEEMETEVINSNSEISEIATEEETAAKNKALIGVLQFLKRRLEEQETAKKILEEAYAKQTAKETSEAKQMAAEAERKLAEAERKLADTQRKLAKAERKLADTKRKLELAQRMAEEKTAKQTAEETLADKEIEEEGPTIIDKNYIDELIKNGIKEVILPASVEEIRTDCWDDFVSIDMSKCHKLTKIGEEKFAECKSLERIDLPDSITTIGEQAFYGCESLKSIRLPKNLTSIGEGAFNICKLLRKLSLPESLKKLESLTGNYRSTINVDLSKCKNIKVLSEKLDYANDELTLPVGVEEVLADVLPSDVKVVLLPPTMKVMEDSADNILCYAPKLESLDFRGVLYVLPQYYDSYCEQASIEGANIQVEKIPDEYLYFYDE